MGPSGNKTKPRLHTNHGPRCRAGTSLGKKGPTTSLQILNPVGLKEDKAPKKRSETQARKPRPLQRFSRRLQLSAGSTLPGSPERKQGRK
ncbi:hypothetical protein PBY51_015545 [Eleginops maclovinus]|uniref:Uncharacterized protein n=1 Tax=Eleginops maclovinus TaxID=56733 RepID=A0AAN7XNF3_ELEMC|nr:hypothetical protein PBY51_015545 [Eleginops maclovinus]